MSENSHDDVNNKSQEMLEPISCFINDPILSLKDACEPLHDLVEYLPSAIKFSKKHAARHDENLSRDESASIHLFTLKWPESLSSFSTILNNTLRNPDRRLLQPWLPYLNLFLTALLKLSDFNGTVWYCVKQDLNEQYKDGTKHVWWGATLCTSSLTSLDSESDDPCTVFSIEATQGKYIGNHSYFKCNEDILLLPGTYFQVAGQMIYKNGLNIIHLKEQQPPYPLLDIPLQMHEESEEQERSNLYIQSAIFRESTTVTNKKRPLSRSRTAEAPLSRVCSVCLQTPSSKLAYRIEAPTDTCTHRSRPRRVCDYCLYQHVTAMLHSSIINQITCPEIHCSRRSFLSDEHIRRILLHNGNKILWYSREYAKSRTKSTKQWIQQNALPCPKCRSPITKNGGCDQMKCLQCLHHFYWSHAIVNGWQEPLSLSRPSTAKNNNKQT